MARALIGLGANLGDRQATLARAVGELASTPCVAVTGQSRWHETAPVGGPAGQAPYLNGAVTLETSLPPPALFERLRQIERRLGRKRSRRWGPRTVDLDLLLYERLEIKSARLVVPHPRMAFRRFVLEPAAEVAAEMVHPTTGWTVGRLRAHLDESASYLAVAGLPGSGKSRLAREAARQSASRFLPDPWAKSRDQRLDDASAAVERLARRAQLLAREAWPAGDDWTLSDFWFDESPVEALVWLDAPGRDEVHAAWRALRGSVTAPRLVVVLDAPLETRLQALAEYAPQDFGDLDHARLSQWGDALVSQTRSVDQGPTLWLAAGDEAALVSELLATLAAAR